MLTKENGFTLPINLKFSVKKKYVFTSIALFIALFLSYSNSFYGDWHFDDFYNIVENPYIQIKSFSLENIKHCIYGLAQERPSRPLSYLSFALNYYFDGTNVFGYHLVNFIIHYLAAVFLFLFILNTFKLRLIKDKYSNIAYPVALLATFLWAINPVHITSITFIVQRMASMAGLFYIMSMYFYVKARTQDKFSYSIILFSFCFLSGLAAVLSKENAAMLPVSIFIYDLFLIKGINKNNLKKYLKIALLPIIIIFIIGFIYVDFSTILDEYKIRDFTMIQRLLTEPRVILFYLSLLFYPISFRLTMLYDIDISRSLFHPWTTIPAILLIFIIIGFALYLAKKRPLISFCIIFYFLNHLIEGSIFNLELIFEHRNYLPSMLLFILPSILIINVLDYFSYKKTIQFACVIGVIIILTGLGDVTYRRNTIISNEFNLWVDNSKKYPNLSRPHISLGNIYFNYNEREKAFQEYEKAMALNNFGSIETRAVLEFNLGLYYFQRAKYSQALPYFKSSHKILHYYIPNLIYIIKIKLLSNKIYEAHLMIEEQIEKYPYNNQLLELFALILYKENNFREADVVAKKILKNNISSAFPLTILAETSRKRGNIRASISLWKLYQQSFSQDSYANLALVELYAQTNDYKSLDQELAKLYCLKKNQKLISYIEETSQNKNLLVYVPDFARIEGIIKKRLKYF